MRYLYLATAAFCFAHVLRDVLQQMGIRDFFTTFMHSGKNLGDKYNLPVAVILLIIGTIAFYLFLTQ